VLLRPRDTAEVARIVAAAAAAGIAIVPQGGIPVSRWQRAAEAGDSISALSRADDRIRAIDAANYTMTVEAGCILQKVQEAPRRLIASPLSLAARAAVGIGGNLSTNAGGIAVLRYGICATSRWASRSCCGRRIWDGLRALRKDTPAMI